MYEEQLDSGLESSVEDGGNDSRWTDVVRVIFLVGRLFVFKSHVLNKVELAVYTLCRLTYNCITIFYHYEEYLQHQETLQASQLQHMLFYSPVSGWPYPPSEFPTPRANTSARSRGYSSVYQNNPSSFDRYYFFTF